MGSATYDTYTEFPSGCHPHRAATIGHAHAHTQIRGYPTLKAVYKGEEVKQFSGQRSVDALKTFIEDAAKSVLTESS